MILIPVKLLENAKQRLSGVLEKSERLLLAQAMLHDVVETIAGWRDRPRVSLVTSDEFAMALALQYELEVIPDHENASETEAIAMATRVCERKGCNWTLVVPGDIPLVTARELQQVVNAAPACGSVLVPASDGRGTNAALRTPAGLFPLRFGNDSFYPHLAGARATGSPCIVLNLPGIGLDVDRCSDLQQLAEASGDSRSQLLAREWLGIGLPLQHHE